MPQIIDPSAIPYGVGDPLRTDSELTPRRLTNPLTEAFTFKWADIPYTIKPGETQVMPEFLALHGAKHLARHILVLKRTKVDPTDASLLYTEEEVRKVMAELIDVEEEEKPAPKKIEPVKEEPKVEFPPVVEIEEEQEMEDPFSLPIEAEEAPSAMIEEEEPIIRRM